MVEPGEDEVELQGLKETLGSKAPKLPQDFDAPKFLSWALNSLTPSRLQALIDRLVKQRRCNSIPFPIELHGMEVSS